MALSVSGETIQKGMRSMKGESREEETTLGCYGQGL